MAVCSWGILKEDWDAMGSWADGDTNGSVSSINPAGQLELLGDGASMSATGRATRSQDIGTVGTGDFTVYIRFQINDMFATGSVGSSGLRFRIDAGTNALIPSIGNGNDGSTDGMWIYDGSAHTKVLTKTWTIDQWYTLRFDVHNSQTDVDVYVDGEASPSVTDADMTNTTAGDGNSWWRGYAGIGDTGEYHVDYYYINDGNCDPDETAGTSDRLLRGVGT